MARMWPVAINSGGESVCGFMGYSERQIASLFARSEVPFCGLWVELRTQRSGSKSQKPFASATQVGVLIGGWLEGLWIYALTQGHVISEVPQSRVRIQVSYWIFVRIEPSQQLLNTRFSKTLQDSDALMHRGFEGTVGI